MKTPKLIKKANELLGADSEKQCEKKRCIKEILGKLKKRELVLKEKVKKEKDKKIIESLKLDLAVIFAQRKKGVGLLKDIKTQRKGNDKKK